MYRDQFGSSPVKRLRLGGAPGVQIASTNCKVQMFSSHTVLPAICRPNHNFCGSNFVKESWVLLLRH